MKTVHIWLSKTLKFRISLLLINVLLGSCYEPFEQDNIPTTTIVAGPDDVTDYNTLGSGKLGFQRDGKYFIVDADARTSWGIASLYNAAISPDGKYIAYTSSYDYNKPTGIILYNIESEVTTKGSHEEERCYNPGWTADSKHLLFEIYQSSYAVQLTRQAIRDKTKTTIKSYKIVQEQFTSRISASAGDDLVFSYLTFEVPSGKSISGIYKMKMDGTELTQLIPQVGMSVGSPAWSPDGNSIAYIGTQLGGTQNSPGYKRIEINIANKDASNATAIISYTPVANHVFSFDVNPSLAWSPDGTRLAFTLPEADGIHIYVIKVDGTGLTKLTSKAGAYDGQLSWAR